MSRADVEESLVAAATELFAQRGPSHVSIRQIADAAGVNHGLVHHYFGSKDRLVSAVLDRCGAAVTAELAAFGAGDDLGVLLGTGSALEHHGRVLAHLILESRDPASLQSGFPAVELLVARLRRLGHDDTSARRRAAQITALVLGWQLFEPFLTTATEIDAGPPDRPAVLADAVALLLRPVLV
jgi:AcrR family transcriptional regulator